MGVGLRRFVSLSLGISLVFSSLSFVSAASGIQNKDYEGHWAQKQIESWLEKGLLKGFEDGSVKPNQSITRAEFVALVNRVFEITQSQPVKFTDLPKTGWMYEEFAKAASQGYITGYGDKIRPNDPVTRQEAAVMLSKLLSLEEEDSAVLNQFIDRDQIAAWSEKQVASMINSGVMKGYPSGKFAPKQAMTRAEAVAILEIQDRMMDGGILVTQSGVIGSKDASYPMLFENVTVNTYGVTLQNALISGDLFLDEGIGEGGVSLDNVTVKGKVIVKGGGANSIHFKNSTLEQIIVQKKGGAVHLVTEGTTQIKIIAVQSGATLELGKGTTVASIILDAVSKITGQGHILSATVNEGGRGSSFEKKPDLIDGSQKDSVAIPTATPPVVVAPGGSSGGGGGGGGEIPAPTSTPIPTTAPTSTPIPTTAPTSTPTPTSTTAPTSTPTTAPTPTPKPVVNIPLLDRISVVQDAVYKYTNSASITVSLLGLPSTIFFETDHAEYYFTTVPEESPDLERESEIFPAAPLLSFPIYPEHIKDYMTIILFNGNGEPIGYRTIKLDLTANFTTLDMSAVTKYNEGVEISRMNIFEYITNRIFLTPAFIGQHPEVKYFSTTPNTAFRVIPDPSKDFNIEHISSTVASLTRIPDSAVVYSIESFDYYDAPFYTQPNFVEEYMVILYDAELKVLGYYQGQAILTDQQVADAVAFKIGKLPVVDQLTLSDEPAVNWAYDRYMKLTEDQKKLLDGTLVNKIIELKVKMPLLKQ